MELDNSFLCPISLEVMEDPVIAADGHSYERREIEIWLLTSELSPSTGVKLATKMLIPNHNLRKAIQDAQARQHRGNQETATRSNPASQRQTHDGISHTGTAVKALTTVVTPLKNATHISLCIPSDAPTKSVCFIAILDVSGSMSLPSREASADAAVEGSQFSRLDLVKHSMNTAIELLRPQDYLMLITFGDAAAVKLNFTCMNAEGKSRANSAINGMVAGGSTNLWGGVELAINHAIKAPQVQNSHVALLLLTDGEPTAAMSPPRGISVALQRMLSDIPRDALTLHCFGYGYGRSLDTPLLRDIATQGQGTFCYVPDGSMVGTVFIHFMCNLLSVALTHVSAELRVVDSNVHIGDCIFPVGFMRPGQTRDLYIPYIGVPTKSCPVELVSLANISPFELRLSYAPIIRETHFQELRYRFINGIDQALELAQRGDSVSAIDAINALDSELAQYSKDTNIQKMREDLISSRPEKGQIKKALEFWSKWGQHYLPSVFFAHARQEKSNFKDASMEMYSTLAIENMIDMSERVFGSITPPKPSISMTEVNRQPIDMSQMINRYGGCFAPNSLVVLADGSKIPFMELRKGMLVKSGHAIKCVVRFDRQQDAPIYRSRGAPATFGITAWHPVLQADGLCYEFPSLSPRFIRSEQRFNALYNIVLEDDGMHVEIDGVQCVTLAHGIATPVAAHPYFGTEKVLRDLMSRPGFDIGLVHFKNPSFVRDPVSGLVGSIVETDAMENHLPSSSSKIVVVA